MAKKGGAMRARMLLALAAVTVVALALSPAQAIHFYRSTDDGCAPADGALTDDPVDEEGNILHGPLAGTVQVLHNAYRDSAEGPSLTGFELARSTVTIGVGESVIWTWNSAHCHSVTFGTSDGYGPAPVDSGFLYPATPPEGPQALPGLFDYPLPDESPTLSWQHTFPTAGTYEYFCIHHASIGMVGTIVVE